MRGHDRGLGLALDSDQEGRRTGRRDRLQDAQVVDLPFAGQGQALAGLQYAGPAHRRGRAGGLGRGGAIEGGPVRASAARRSRSPSDESEADHA